MVERFANKSVWDEVCDEYERERLEAGFADCSSLSVEDETAKCFPAEYLETKVFPVLLPGLEALLNEVQTQHCMRKKKLFNACDFLTEWLYNHNPCRLHQQTHVRFADIPFVKEWLSKHPRRAVPLHLLLSEEKAALLIQSYWRGYKVRSQPEVQELRQWQRVLRQDGQEIVKKEQELREQRYNRGDTPKSYQWEELKHPIQHMGGCDGGQVLSELEGLGKTSSSSVSIMVLSPTPQSTIVLSPTVQLTQDSSHLPMHKRDSLSIPEQDHTFFSLSTPPV